VLVTGASGFVGGHLVERLSAEGRRIRALLRPNRASDALCHAGAEIVVGDLSDPDALDRAVDGVEAVIHLAAVKHATRPEAYARVNADGCQRLADAIRRTRRDRPMRVVYLSSYAAAGPSASGRARVITDAARPISHYGRSKLRGEQWMAGLERDGISVIMVRAPVVYGPGDRDLLPLFRVVRRGWAPLPAGDERQIDLIFAADLARVLARAASTRDEPVPTGTYAVADPTRYSWPAALKAMGDALGSRPRLVRVPVPLFKLAGALSEAGGRLAGRAVPLNRDKAREMVASGWVCDVSGSECLLPADEVTALSAGMRQTVKWYRDQRWLS
jgi:nucleoside-diphosphate-sugar epimerase